MKILIIIFLAVVFIYAKSKYTHIYIEILVKYVVSVIDYNISLFRRASRSNYAIIDYTMLQSTSIVIVRNGIFHWPVKRINLILWISIYIYVYGSAFIVIFRNDLIQP
jgi:hypothetical protein